MRKKWVMVLAMVMIFSLLLMSCAKKKTTNSGTSDSLSGDTSEWTNSDGTTGENSDASGSDISNNDTSGAGSGATTSGTDTVSKVIETDKTTGEIYLDDELNDYTKVKSHGADLQFDKSQASTFEGDMSRLCRMNVAADSWLVYELSTIKEFAIITYWANDADGKKIGDITFFTSTDNKNWTAVASPVVKSKEFMGGGWLRKEISKTGLDPATKYLKIVLPKGGSPIYSPNLGRVRINVISKLYDPERFREGRAAATFYVDSTSGSDNNDGKSQAKAFKSLYKVSSKYYQPGDKILFKSGLKFSGSLTLNGDGSASQPITIGSYGSGAKPVINARGGIGVTLKMINVVVDNLEITNPTGTIGIQVIALTSGANKNITIKNCYIHDIDTKFTTTSYTSGGIDVIADGMDPTWFEGLTIQNNVIKSVNRVGIGLESQWAKRPGTWGHNTYVSDTNGWYPFKSVNISGNSLDKTGGDGIIVYAAVSPVIENNIVLRAMTSNASMACAGLWIISTNDALMQNNEVAYTGFKPGQTDGEGYDIDIAAKRTVFQYNYSHDNGGGFLLMCTLIPQGDHGGHIIRYNVSVNDALVNGQGIFMLTGTITGTEFYNNTIYMGGPARTVRPVDARNFNGGGTPTNFNFRNNIFYGETNLTYDWMLTDAVNFSFTNNVYYGVSPVGGANAKGYTDAQAKTADPNFVNTAEAKADTNTQTNITYVKLDGRAYVSNFKPRNNIAGATVIANNGDKDFFGTAVGSTVFYGAVKP